MARFSLRKKIREMEVNESFRPPRDYEATTIRNLAAIYSSSLGRTYSVHKEENGTHTITRKA